MPCLRHFTLLIAIFTFVACHKSSSPPSNNPPPVTGAVKINLNYPTGSIVQTPFELIVGEPTGKILLDTVATMNIPVMATLSTNDTLLDVTTITNYDTNYTVTTYRSINASTLYNLVPGNYRLYTHVSNNNLTPATVYYTNVPFNSIQQGNEMQTLLFTSFPYLDWTSTSFDPLGRTLKVTYEKDGAIPAYMLLPSAGLYNLHNQVNGIDTVDLSNMDTAISLNFNRPYPFTVSWQGSTLFGVLDTTDFSKLVAFSDVLQANNRPGVDMEYPKTKVQNYELSVSAYNNNNDYFSYYYYGNALPLTLPFPTESNFSLASSQPSNFSISFSGGNPTDYVTDWTTSKLGFFVYSAPGQNTFQPLPFLTSLKSHMLESVDFSPLKFIDVELDNISGMNYAGYMSYISSSAVGQTRAITSAASLVKIYP